MHLNRPRVLGASLFGLAAALLLAVGIAPQVVGQIGGYQEGVHYFPLSTRQRTNSGKDKVEVMEFFWYGCPHCAQYEPLVQEWKEKNADKVDFVVIPVVWNKITEVHARLYYTARALGVLDRVHDDVYSAILYDGKRLDHRELARQFFAKYGISEKKFEATWSSFLTEHAVKRAGRQTQLYEISGTPSLIVNGEYRIIANRSTSSKQTLDVAQRLVNRQLARK